MPRLLLAIIFSALALVSSEAARGDAALTDAGGTLLASALAGPSAATLASIRETLARNSDPPELPRISMPGDEGPDLRGAKFVPVADLQYYVTLSEGHAVEKIDTRLMRGVVADRVADSTVSLPAPQTMTGILGMAAMAPVDEGAAQLPGLAPERAKDGSYAAPVKVRQGLAVVQGTPKPESISSFIWFQAIVIGVIIGAAVLNCLFRPGSGHRSWSSARQW